MPPQKRQAPRKVTLLRGGRGRGRRRRRGIWWRYLFSASTCRCNSRGGGERGGGKKSDTRKGETLEGKRENDERAAAHAVGTHRNTLLYTCCGEPRGTPRAIAASIIPDPYLRTFLRRVRTRRTLGISSCSPARNRCRTL